MGYTELVCASHVDGYNQKIGYSGIKAERMQAMRLVGKSYDVGLAKTPKPEVRKAGVAWHTYKEI